MTLRQSINVAYAHLRKVWPESDPEGLDEWLEEPFDSELTEDELAHRKYVREAKAIGAVDGQKALMDAFAMRPAHV